MQECDNKIPIYFKIPYFILIGLILFWKGINAAASKAKNHDKQTLEYIVITWNGITTECRFSQK